MGAEEMFRDYLKMKRELSVVIYQISHFTGVSENDVIHSMSLSHPAGDEKVQISEHLDKTAKAAIAYKIAADRLNDDWYQFLLKRYQHINDEIGFFEYAVSQLDDKKRGVIQDLLEGEMTWDTIALTHNISRAMVGKYRKVAIQEMDARYNIQEKQELEYMLS